MRLNRCEEDTIQIQLSSAKLLVKIDVKVCVDLMLMNVAT